MVWISALILVGLVAAAKAADCGTPSVAPNVSGTRIVGGQDAKENSWPWMVALYYKGMHVCGGALIDEEWVITAAHCAFDAKASDWQVYAGKHKLSKSEGTEQKLRVALVLPHLNYNENNMKNDIAVIKLSTKAVFNDAVGPVCLPAKSQTFANGKVCYATGWGETRPQGRNGGVKAVSDALQQVAVPVIKAATCRSNNYYGKSFIGKQMICAGYPNGGMDACQGDSGGPLVAEVNGKWTIAGITSWGYGCAKAKSPGVYTKVTKQVDWVNSMMANYG